MPRLTNDPKCKFYSYIKVDCDDDFWVDASNWLPDDFDLCYLRREDGNIKVGWRSCRHWDGYSVGRHEDFIHWKVKDAAKKKSCSERGKKIWEKRSASLNDN